MSDYIEVHWTSGSLDEARRIARLAVQERYVACAQIIPWIESIYLWNDKMETTQESKVIFKTTLFHFNQIKEIIEKNCKYEVPEITWVKIEGGNELYLEWLNKSITIPSV